jgi:hypothetical protein
MAHYAKVVDGTVVNVIVAEADFFDSFIDDSPGIWLQTSYNTHGGVHYDPITKEPDSTPQLRYNYATVGGLYDQDDNAFYEKQPYPSWTLNTDSYLWEAPVPRPNEQNKFSWNEETQSWDQVDG